MLQLGAVKIYVAAVEALRKKERQDETTQFTTKIDGFLSFIPPPWMLMYFLLQVCFESHSPCVWPNSGFWCCVFLYFTDNSNDREFNLGCIFFLISPILRCRQSGYNPYKYLAKFGYQLDMKVKSVKYPSVFWLSTRKRKRKANNSWFGPVGYQFQCQSNTHWLSTYLILRKYSCWLCIVRVGSQIPTLRIVGYIIT